MKATAKRRRSKLQIKEEKKREEQEKSALVNKIQEIDNLKAQVAELTNTLGQAQSFHDQMH